MDDVFGELDIYRAGKISEYLFDIGQAFITMTDLTRMENLSREGSHSVITVDHGKAAYA